MKTEKRFLIVMLVCLVAITAVAGTTVLVNNRAKKKAEIDLNEAAKQTEAANQANEQVSKKPAGGNNEKTTEKTTQKETASVPVQKPTDKPGQGGNSSASQDSQAAGITQGIAALSFGEDSELYWPVDGAVILEFNMEHTIYFPTLDQYQCNPAVILQSEAGKGVASAAKGIVTEIGSNEEIGNYVVMALGSGFELTYGQLDDILVKKGDSVDAGVVIASVAKPTKYYTVEGDNLYLELTKDGVPVDPLDYIDYE